MRQITLERFLNLFDGVARRRCHRDSDRDGVTVIAPTIELGGGGYDGFTRKALPVHTDGSALDRPPELIALYVDRAAHVGGETLVADGGEVALELAHVFPQEYLHLQEAIVSFGADPGYRGPVLTPAQSGVMTIRFRDDGLVNFRSVESAVEVMRDVIRDRTISLMLSSGDAYFLQNARWLHGRTAFDGDRSAIRLMGDFEARALDAIPIGFPAPPPQHV
jgi:alpha-ketoglutarate-dependent taurine dioxygenase